MLPAAIGIILNADHTQVLLVKRRDVAVWVLPGGGVEENEKPEEALKREIHEETGYQVRMVRLCAEYTPINRLASFTSIFIAQIESGEMRLSEETADIAFYPIAKLPSCMFPPHVHWLKEALSHSILIRRPLIEVSYVALYKYLICHPWQVLRYAWTRWMRKEAGK